MASNSKQYGLIMPKKANQGLMRPRPSVFDDNSDSGDEGTSSGATDWVKKALKRGAEKGFQRKQTQLDMQKAIDEDPTVYQYDEVYEKIEEKKAELLNTKQKLDKKPRYIQSLLMQAERRKREQERRNERLVQKEREAEGDKFKDKESFVTSAYRQKLEEFKQLEEEERRQDAIEALTDVSKQKDLSGFYRHLYRVTTGDPNAVQVKEEKEDPSDGDPVSEETQKPKDEEEILEVEHHEEGRTEVEKEVPEEASTETVSEAKSSSRQYRKRRDSSGSSDSETEVPNEVENNLDADSDFSVDSSSDTDSNSDSSKRKSKKRKADESNVEKDGANVDAAGNPKCVEEDNEDKNKKVKKDGAVKENGNEPEKNSDPAVRSEEKKAQAPKVNIWEKRTVGEVFESALQRYYQRKAAKLASKG